MRNKHALILFFMGWVATALGALFKVLHWSYSDSVLLIGMIMQALGGIIFLLKLFFIEKGKEFLRS